MKRKDWSKIVRALIDSGWTQQSLAKEVGVSQSRISKILANPNTIVSWEVGDALLRLE